MTTTISITDKGKTITYHAHHMRDVIDHPDNRLDYRRHRRTHSRKVRRLIADQR